MDAIQRMPLASGRFGGRAFLAETGKHGPRVKTYSNRAQAYAASQKVQAIGYGSAVYGTRPFYVSVEGTDNTARPCD